MRELESRYFNPGVKGSWLGGKGDKPNRLGFAFGFDGCFEPQRVGQFPLIIPRIAITIDNLNGANDCAGREISRVRVHFSELALGGQG